MDHGKMSVSAVLILAGGLCLAGASPLQAQRMGGAMGGGAPGQMGNQPGANNPGMGMNGAPGRPNSMQSAAELNFIGTMRRNNKAETELSKLAVKNSGNDNVKKMAQQVIAQNHRMGSSLNGAAASANMSMPEEIPSDTKKALKDMKKLTGTPFDKMYLSQMDGYVKNDQKTATDASGSVNSPDLKAMAMQLRNMADSRAQQLAQVAQSENFKME